MFKVLLINSSTTCLVPVLCFSQDIEAVIKIIKNASKGTNDFIEQLHKSTLNVTVLTPITIDPLEGVESDA